MGATNLAPRVPETLGTRMGSTRVVLQMLIFSTVKCYYCRYSFHNHLLIPALADVLLGRFNFFFFTESKVLLKLHQIFNISYVPQFLNPLS